MKPLKYYFTKAKKDGFGIGQFNFSALEQLEGIVRAAKKKKVPVIIGTSPGEAAFLGLEKIIALRNYYRSLYPSIFLNLDHGRDIKIIKKAIDLGYDCVHFDGGNLSLEKNIEITKKLVQYAHKKRCLVEGEIKSIKGGSIIHQEMIKFNSSGYENPNQAQDFAQRTKIDSLAINIGNVHGVYKKPIKLNIKLLKEISEQVPCFLVLHGGSGTKEKDLKQAIKNGIVKININTELRMVWKESLKKELNKKEIKPYRIYPKVIEEVQKRVEKKISLFKW